MSNRERTVIERVADWLQAFEAVKAEVTPDPLRRLINDMTKVPTDGTDVMAYASLVNASLSLASLVASNDRTAAQVAEAMTRNGLTREKDLT